MLRQREHDDGGGHVVFSEGDKHGIRCVSGRVIGSKGERAGERHPDRATARERMSVRTRERKRERARERARERKTETEKERRPSLFR